MRGSAVLRRTVAVLVAVGAAVAMTAALVTSASAGTAEPSEACQTPWTTGADTAATQNPSPLVAVRTGVHPCFDRVVFQIAGSVGAGWDVRYVNVVHAEGSGNALPVPGGARLEVHLRHPAHDAQGKSTFTVPVGGSAANVAGYPVLRSVVFGGSFEGYTTLGVGTRATLPFRVFAVPGPGADTRIVLDVARR